jgi:hypothetical protein
LSAQREIRRTDVDLRWAAASVAADAAARAKAAVARELEGLQEPSSVATEVESATALAAGRQPPAAAEMPAKEANAALDAASVAAERAGLIAARAEERARGANMEATRSAERGQRFEAAAAQAAAALANAVAEGVASVDSVESDGEEKGAWLALETCAARIIKKVHFPSIFASDKLIFRALYSSCRLRLLAALRNQLIPAATERTASLRCSKKRAKSLTAASCSL